MSNVFQKEGEWFYRDEDSLEIGPYETSIIALVAYGNYCVGIVEGLVLEVEVSKNRMSIRQDLLSQEDSDRHIYEDTEGQFHFWDESGAYSYGPFSSMSLAQENLAQYVEQLNSKTSEIHQC